MSHFNLIAIDLAKTVLQVGKFSISNKASYNKPISRKELIKLFAKEKPSLIAMEACSGAHYWARLALAHGHQVKLMHARSVKAYRVGQKTDRNDVEAIAAAARQDNLHTVQVLSVEAQSAQSIDRARKLASNQKIALSNQLRGLLLEFGITVGQGNAALARRLPEVLEDSENGLPTVFRTLIHSLWEMIAKLTEQARHLDLMAVQFVKQSSICQKFLALEGVGPVSALKLWVCLGNGSAFKSGKNAAACIGVTPKQHSSGGKERIGHISRLCAEQTLRSALFQGAMSVIRQLKKREPRTTKERWLRALIDRRSDNVAAIALANKNVRTAFALLTQGTKYQPVLL